MYTIIVNLSNYENTHLWSMTILTNKLLTQITSKLTYDGELKSPLQPKLRQFNRHEIYGNIEV